MSRLNKAFFLLGPPGAGKGTVCNYLVQCTDIYVISTRTLLEEAQATGFINEGCLAPDEMVCQLLVKKLTEVEGVVIIDTLRSVRQCEVIWNFLSIEMGTPITTIHLSVSEEEAIQRMQERRRNDDTAAAKRMADYRGYGPAVLKWLKTATDVVEVNANLSPNAVQEEARRQVELSLSTRQCLSVPDFLRHDLISRREKLFA